MYLKRLELLGFKSFCDKTTLHFEPGITAVVGPNGCGKSNIFDSVRWVLGEQSVKALRGSDMQDVIFNGTDSKEPLSMADVTLVFDNKNKFFPSVDNDEVAVTRRIFRSGESEYLLNKSQVRLKDILELLMGTGIGAESYSLVQQGKIDLVLSSKPEDRRMVFDEAAGITKYKSQKKEALRKLEETDQNLLRVNDIVTEVKRQINSLERQASKARRYKEVFEELKADEIKLALIQKEKLIREKDAIVSSLKELESRESGLLGHIKEQEALILSRQDQLKAIEANIAQVNNQILNLENTLIRDKQHIGFNEERIAELEKTKAYLESQIQQAQSRLAQNQEKFNRLKTEYEGLSKNIEDKTALFKTKEAELNSISSAMKLSVDSIGESKRQIMDLAVRISEAKNMVTEFVSAQQILSARKKRLDIEKLKVSEEKSAVENNLSGINSEVAELEKNFAELSSKLAVIKAELDSESQGIKNIDSDIENLERQNLSLLSQKDFLEKLKLEYEGIGESMNATIYLDKPPQEKMSGLVIKVRDFPELNGASLDGAPSPAFKLSGEAKPIDLDTRKINERIEQIQHKIDSLKVIKRVKESHIEELQHDMSASQGLIRNQEINLANKRAYSATIQGQFDKIKAEEELINLELSDVHSELSQLEGKINSSSSGLAELEGRQRLAEETIINQQNSISLNNKLKEEHLVIITQTRTELDALQGRLSSDQFTIKGLEDACQQDSASVSELQARMDDSINRSAALKSEITGLENNIFSANEQIKALAVSLESTQVNYNELVAQLNDIAAKIDSDKADLEELKNSLYRLQMQNKDVDFKYLNIKERILQAYKVDIEVLGIPEDSGREFNETSEDGRQEPQTETDADTLSGNIKKLKEKLDSYGSVNLVAIEEYDELKKRYDFLNQQQTDLVTAKESLHEAILKINRTTRKMFLETFEAVKAEFRSYFKLLFNGGDAQVFLMDENDPLESGIEIICRPPGKKLQNVLLLSGGEKSMSAIALIFAIFKVKPAPFCILDEIDAALDEANVDRFGRILQEFSAISQFIVITHNKKTIANANVMYGITMEESGVSKIVSVKFSQKQRVEEKQPDDSVVEEAV